MEMLTYTPAEQVDIAEDLGAVPTALPEIEFYEDFMASVSAVPPELVEGILHQGCKMVLAGSSKSNKSWALLDLALSVACGAKWWGRRCTKAPVVYINFELPRWSINRRIASLVGARREFAGFGRSLALWNLRGRNADLTVLRPLLEERLARHQFGMIILDPAYKLLGDRDENANGEIAGLMNEFEALACSSGAAVVIAHHFAKGDSTVKSSIDRMSGAGAWARDPDSLLILTPHEEPSCFTVNATLRNLPPVDDFVVEWNFPLLTAAADLDPESLRQVGGRRKKVTDREFVEAVLPGRDGRAFGGLVETGQRALGLSRRTAERYVARLTAAGVLRNSGGLYWRATA